MSIRLSKWIVMPAAVLLLGSVALAQDTSASGSSAQSSGTTTSTPAKQPTIAERKENQQDRIANGVKSGQLTAGETANLESKEAAINGETRADRAANGGKLTHSEKQPINRQQNQLSKQIYQDKHNANLRESASLLQNLYRNFALQVFVMGAIDFTHAPSADFLGDAIVA